MMAGAFEILLGRLSPDRDEAAAAYQQLRLKLVRFFESQGCPFAEDFADESIQRAVRKLAEGVEIQAQDPYVYLRGVARLMLHEHWRSRERIAPLDELLPQQLPSFHPREHERQAEERQTRERQLQCLERCLNELPPESRQLFLHYHREQPSAKIDHRATLARELGIDITALRNRVTRLRKKLEQCVNACCQAGR